MKKFLAGLSAVAVLAAGGVAMVGLTSDTAIAQEDTTTTEDPVEGEAQLEGKRGHRGHGLSVAAEAIGIETEDLVAAIREGATIAEVAEANGSSGQAVIDAMVANATERIDAAVADGNLTAEEGAEKLVTITDRVTDMVNGDLERPERGDRDHRGRRGHGLSTAADTIGISVEDLKSALTEGSSIAEVAEANGSSGQAVIDAVVANASERIDAAVADGNLTAEEGAEKLADTTARITDLVNNEIDFSQRGERGDRGPRGPHSEDVDGEDVVDV